MSRPAPTPVRFNPVIAEQVNEAAVRLGLSRNRLITSAVEQFLAENAAPETVTGEGFQELKCS